MEVYKEYFAPEYMKYSTLIPVTNHEDGSFKVFDLSSYNPYDIIVASAKELMKSAEKQNYSTAIFHMERVMKIYPKSIGRFHIILGEMYIIQRDFKNAKFHAYEAQIINPDHEATRKLIDKIKMNEKNIK